MRSWAIGATFGLRALLEPTEQRRFLGGRKRLDRRHDGVRRLVERDVGHDVESNRALGHVRIRLGAVAVRYEKIVVAQERDGRPVGGRFTVTALALRSHDGQGSAKRDRGAASIFRARATNFCDRIRVIGQWSATSAQLRIVASASSNENEQDSEG